MAYTAAYSVSIEGKAIDTYPIMFLSESLQNSLVYLDDKPNEFAKIASGVRSYPLVDFLYFSAITIATLGFGDIVPNDSQVRVLVMCEAMLGLVIIGGLVSVFFSVT